MPKYAPSRCSSDLNRFFSYLLALKSRKEGKFPSCPRPVFRGQIQITLHVRQSKFPCLHDVSKGSTATAVLFCDFVNSSVERVTTYFLDEKVTQLTFLAVGESFVTNLWRTGPFMRDKSVITNLQWIKNP